MANRLERRLDLVSAEKPERLDIVIDCPCGACEKVPWSPEMRPRVIHIGPDGIEERVYDLCPLIKYD